MIMILLILALLILIILLLFRFSLLSPAVFFVFPWFISLFLIAMGIFSYDQPLNHDSFRILVLTIFLFPLGVFAHRVMRKPSKRNAPEIQKRFDVSLLEHPLWVWFSTVMVLLYGGLVILEYSNNIIGLVSSTTGLSTIRATHWKSVGDVTDLSDLLISATRPFCTINLISLPLWIYVTRKRRFIFVAAFALLFLGIESIGEGGRGLLVFSILTLIYSSLFVYFKGRLTIHEKIKRKTLRITLKGIFVGMVASYILMIWFPYARNPNLYDNYEYFFTRRARVHFSELSYTMIDLFGEKNTIPFFTGLSYFTNPIPSLTLFYEYSDFESWYAGGAYNFPFFSKVVNVIQGKPYSWNIIKAELSAIPASRGYASNPWATGVRDLLVDFGESGTIIFLFLFGFLSDLLFVSTRRKPSSEKIILLSLISELLLAFAFYGFLHNGFFVYPVLLIIGIQFLRHLKFFKLNTA
jgi:hypothetical protein